jgi:predicted nucleic acid-binding protein
MQLDTNAYSALVRGLQSITEIVDGVPELKISLPVIAELRYGFVKGSRTEYNEQVLQKFLAQPQISIIVPSLKTTEYYAQLQLYCSKRGRVLSHNDLWIAALAREANEVLITFDHDFKVLESIFHDKLIILEN